MTLKILAFPEPNSFRLHSRNLSENLKKMLISTLDIGEKLLYRGIILKNVVIVQ